MRPEIRDRVTGEMLDALLARYDVRQEDVDALDGFESFIYAVHRDDDDFILRVSHGQRRSEALIQGEVDWINYLADGGATVARARPSAHGRLVEAIADGAGEQFLATAFVKAEGKPPREVGLSDDFHEAYGQLLGKMHALSKRYCPTDPMAYRPQWDDPIMLEADQHLPESELLVAARFQEVVDHLRALPINDEIYGLIHFDAHEGNMFVDGRGTITLFDFDDCHYHWYINDIAIVIFYAVSGHEDQVAFLNEFLPCFLRGYARENRLESSWLNEISWFLKLREIDLYAIIHRSFDVENLTDPWVSRYMDGRREKIKQGVPYLDVDFGSFAAWLKAD